MILTDWPRPVARPAHMSNGSVVVVAQPLVRDGSMAKDHGASEARKLPRPWTRGRMGDKEHAVQSL